MGANFHEMLETGVSNNFQYSCERETMHVHTRIVKYSWVGNFITLDHKILKKFDTPRKVPAIRYIITVTIGGS